MNQILYETQEVSSKNRLSQHSHTQTFPQMIFEESLCKKHVETLVSIIKWTCLHWLQRNEILS